MVGKSYYADGKKYCRRCEIYLHHDGTYCTCCGMALRVTPTSKKDKVKLKLVRANARSGIFLMMHKLLAITE